MMPSNMVINTLVEPKLTHGVPLKHAFHMFPVKKHGIESN